MCLYQLLLSLILPFLVKTTWTCATWFERSPNKPPKCTENTVCYKLPVAVKSVKVFIVAMRDTVDWNQIICKETKYNISNTNKTGHMFHHNRIWCFFCPCAGASRKWTKLDVPNCYTKLWCFINSTVKKDGSIKINSKTVKSIQTVTIRIKDNTKKVVVATNVTSVPMTQPTHYQYLPPETFHQVQLHGQVLHPLLHWKWHAQSRMILETQQLKSIPSHSTIWNGWEHLSCPSQIVPVGRGSFWNEWARSQKTPM